MIKAKSMGAWLCPHGTVMIDIIDDAGEVAARGAMPLETAASFGKHIETIATEALAAQMPPAKGMA